MFNKKRTAALLFLAACLLSGCSRTQAPAVSSSAYFKGSGKELSEEAAVWKSYLNFPDADGASCVTLPSDYEKKKIAFEKEPVLTDGSLDDAIEGINTDYYYETSSKKDENPAAEGDYVILKVKSDEKEDGTPVFYDDYYSFTIGDGTAIQEIDDAIRGVIAGQTVKVHATLPDDFKDDLAGKTLNLNVTLWQLRKFPEMTDKRASYLTNGRYKTWSSYREWIRSCMEYEYHKDYRTKCMETVIDRLHIKAKDVPDELALWAYARLMNSAGKEAESFGMTTEEFMKENGYYAAGVESPQDLYEYMMQNKDKRMTLVCFVEAVAKDKGITVTNDDYRKMLKIMYEDAVYNRGDYDTIEDYEKAEGESNIEWECLYEKVFKELETCYS